MKYVVAFIAAIFGLMTHPFVRWRFQIPLMMAIMLFLMEGCAADTHQMYATAHVLYDFGGFIALCVLGLFAAGQWQFALALMVFMACALASGCAT